MLQGNENESKNAMTLNDWVTSEMTKGRTRDNILTDAIIPLDTSLDIENFDDFALKRKELLRQTLRKNIGME